MSEGNPLRSFCSPLKICEKESSNEFESFSISGISKIKEEEIKRLLASLREKHEKYNILQQFDSESDLPVKVIKKDLLEKYALNINCHDYNPKANVLFGLSDVGIDRQTPTKELSFLKEEHLRAGDFFSKSLFTGFSAEVQFLPKPLIKRLEVLKAMVSLHKEHIHTLSCMEECKLTAAKVRDLLILKQQTAVKAAKTYMEGLYALCLEAQLQKYTILKDYFSEDMKVVDASYKLRECIACEYENLQWKEKDLQKKIEAFKKLEGSKFDQLLREYRIVCESISNKEWTLQNLIEHGS